MKRLALGLVPVVMIVALVACAPATVKDKKVVDIQYKGTLSDGTVFGESTPDQPLEFMVGQGQLIPALEKELVGLKVGDKKTVTVVAADAYGTYDDSAVMEIPKEQFPTDFAPETGKSYQMQTAQGTIQLTVNEIKEKSYIIDFNHPLAGKDLTFDITVTKIRDATKAELASAASSTASDSSGSSSTGTPETNPAPATQQ
jgi:peptidylprolyl isomerase